MAPIRPHGSCPRGGQLPGVPDEEPPPAANGLAVANQSAIPTPMMNDASIRPRSRKTLVCSTFISSGWRAEASMYFPAMMPTPMQAPMAPSPMINPQAIATYATFVISSLQCERVRSMVFVRLADVNQGQHHENEGLQQHDQDVKDGARAPRRDR